MTRFTCKEALRCLDDLHGGVIAVADKEALRVHLAVCDECRARSEQWDWLGDLGRNTELRPLDDVLERRLLSGKGLRVGASPRPRSRRWLVAAAAVAALFILAPVAALSLSHWRAREKPPAEDPVVTPVVAPPVESAPEVVTPAEEPAAEVPIERPARPAPVRPADVTPAAEEDLDTALAFVTEPSPPSIDELSRSAREHRRAREFALACDDYQQLRDLYPDTPEAVASPIVLGQMKLSAMGRPEQAVDHFREYLASSPDGDLAEDARVGEIRALAALSRHGEVDDACVQYLRWHPRGSASAEVMHYRADALLALGRGELALDVYRELEVGWPDTRHGAWARARIDELATDQPPAE